MRLHVGVIIEQATGYFNPDYRTWISPVPLRVYRADWLRLTGHLFTLSVKASPFCSWVCLGRALTEHLSLWCHRWHSDDPGHPAWHDGYSPPMTSLRQTQYQTEHCCSSHCSSCRDREGFIWMETGFQTGLLDDDISSSLHPSRFMYLHLFSLHCSDLTNESHRTSVSTDARVKNTNQDCTERKGKRRIVDDDDDDDETGHLESKLIKGFCL